MGFWEFITSATPPTAIVAVGGWVAIEKDFLTALGIMTIGAIIYFIALATWVHMRKHEIRWSY
jgi:hypothetical protein